MYLSLPPEEERGVDVAVVGEDVPPPSRDGAAGRGDGGDGAADDDALGGGGDGGQVLGDAAGGGDARAFHLDEQKCLELVAAKKWAQLDIYLCQLLRSISEIPENHPILLLPVRRELVMRMLRYVSKEAAVGMFKSIITPLRRDAGLFVPISGYIKREVNSIQNKLEDSDWSTDWPGNESFVEEILDYMRLYFPEVVRHDQLSEGRKKNVWNLTLILRNDEGIPIKSKNKTHYRCLACGWNGGSKSGIKAQESHLIGDKGRGNASCDMTTPRIYHLLRVPLTEPRAEPRTMPGVGGKRKRQPPRTRQVQNRGHLGQSSRHHAAPNTDSLLLNAVATLPDEVPEPVQVQGVNLHGALAGLPQEVSEPVQQLNLHGTLAGLPQEVPDPLQVQLLDLQDALAGLPQAPEPLPSHMDVLVVLESRRRMSLLVDALVRFIPGMDFVRQARGALNAILELCKDSMGPGLFTRMVSAPAILQALGTMKGALSVLESQFLITGQETITIFTSINQEVDALEQLCLQAMNNI